MTHNIPNNTKVNIFKRYSTTHFVGFDVRNKKKYSAHSNTHFNHIEIVKKINNYNKLYEANVVEISTTTMTTTTTNIQIYGVNLSNSDS